MTAITSYRVESFNKSQREERERERGKGREEERKRERERLWIHRAFFLCSSWFRRIVHGDRFAWSISSSSSYRLFPSSSVAALVIVPRVPTSLLYFARGLPLRFTVFRSRVARLRRCINRTFSTVTPASWTRKREHLTTRVCRCAESRWLGLKFLRRHVLNRGA